MKLLNIDVTKIDKTGLFVGKPRADGSTPKYLDLALMHNRNGRDEFGNDGFVVQSLSKERRAAGEKGPIIGNWKNTERSGRGAQAPAVPAPIPNATGQPPKDDDVPF